MARRPLDTIELTLPRRIGEQAQEETLPPYPNKPEQHQWGLNRAPWIHPWMPGRARYRAGAKLEHEMLAGELKDTAPPELPAPELVAAAKGEPCVTRLKEERLVTQYGDIAGAGGIVSVVKTGQKCIDGQLYRGSWFDHFEPWVEQSRGVHTPAHPGGAGAGQQPDPSAVKNQSLIIVMNRRVILTGTSLELRSGLLNAPCTVVSLSYEYFNAANTGTPDVISVPGIGWSQSMSVLSTRRGGVIPIGQHSFTNEGIQLVYNAVNPTGPDQTIDATFTLQVRLD